MRGLGRCCGDQEPNKGGPTQGAWRCGHWVPAEARRGPQLQANGVGPSHASCLRSGSNQRRASMCADQHTHTRRRRRRRRSWLELRWRRVGEEAGISARALSDSHTLPGSRRAPPNAPRTVYTSSTRTRVAFRSEPMTSIHFVVHPLPGTEDQLNDRYFCRGPRRGAPGLERWLSAAQGAGSSRGGESGPCPGGRARVFWGLNSCK